LAVPNGVSCQLLKMKPRFRIPRRELLDFCYRWKVAELSLFGSVLRDDFGPDSDIDVLVSFAPDAQWSLLDLVEMQEELEKIFGREVDLVEREGLRNPFRRRAILSQREIIATTRIPEMPAALSPLPVEEGW